MEFSIKCEAKYNRQQPRDNLSGMLGTGGSSQHICSKFFWMQNGHFQVPARIQRQVPYPPTWIFVMIIKSGIGLMCTKCTFEVSLILKSSWTLMNCALNSAISFSHEGPGWSPHVEFITARKERRYAAKGFRCWGRLASRLSTSSRTLEHSLPSSMHPWYGTYEIPQAPSQSSSSSHFLAKASNASLTIPNLMCRAPGTKIWRRGLSDSRIAWNTNLENFDWCMDREEIWGFITG